jgi:uncharacterized metal-binding protein YceD (DUF177 family)
LAVGAYSINIVGLSNKQHLFEYELDDSFFKLYGADLVSEGRFKADVLVDKRETFLEVDFSISGTARLTCDRSLEKFDYPIDITRKIVFKYGDVDEELTDEIVVINREAVALEVGQYMYEFIALAIPLKKLHPRFGEEPDGDDTGRIVYTSEPGGDDTSKGDDEIDPRWNELKKLK